MLKQISFIRLIKLKALPLLMYSLCCCIANVAIAQKRLPPPLPVSMGKDGRFIYVPDSLGNRIPDFSYCGYMASEKPIPMATVQVVVPPAKGDATYRIQAALDYVANLPLDKNGFRGAVLLEKGRYEIFGQLKITASGVVLRGSGMNETGTILYGTGTDRQTLIRVVGKAGQQVADEVTISDDYVPVGAMSFKISSGAFQTGDHVIIHRPSVANWITALGTEHFGGGITSLGWKPGDQDLFFDRRIVSISGNTNIVTVDAPITTALDKQFGGGTISTYQWDGRINNVGIENISCISSYDKLNPKDEAHRWMAITIENAEDVWVRQLGFEHFAGSAVNVLETAKRVTVEDCISLDPVSEIGGERRYTFITSGQQTLFQRCYAEYGYHDFATGYCAPGPNAFVQCESHLPYNFSGGIDSWASGILFDVAYVDGNALRFGDRGQDGQGAGWSAANSLFWNCSASKIDCYKPPTAQNWSFGSWAQFSGDGYWTASNDAVNPRSFYYAQLSQRLNKNTDALSQLLKVETDASSSPSVEVAAQLTAEAVKPHMQLKEWISLASQRNPINTNSTATKTIDAIGFKKITPASLAPAMQIKNGWITRGNIVLTGWRKEVPWWTGGIHGKDLINASPAITRFVPGRTGKGFTDDLDELTDSMKLKHVIGMEQHYALWYERRRDDHERIRRMDGEVWAPFYELPFARTGKELAWDGLSKYDLTKYNSWYWGRLKQYSDLADQKGLLLVHQNYFQHNIIEAGAHYADFPWRTANNINSTGFPEPPPYAGDKRIFLAEQFYDINDPVRRELHKKYIRQCLDNFKDNNGVIQLIGEEFTGPLHFVKFWLDVIKQWEKETGKHPVIGLSVTKDVQDSILANPAYASIVDLVDIRYWHYQADGTAYEPKGGQNLAPRQHARLLKPKPSSFEQVYRAVKQYRKPGKAVLYSSDSFDKFGWAVFIAGGSLPVIPALPAQFLTDAATMKPVDQTNNDQWMLADEGRAYIIYGRPGFSVNITAPIEQATFLARWIDPRNGNMIGSEQKLKAADLKTLKNNNSSEAVLWLTRIN